MTKTTQRKGFVLRGLERLAATMGLLVILAIFAGNAKADPPSCSGNGKGSPENPSAILFIAGSATFAFRYVKAALLR